MAISFVAAGTVVTATNPVVTPPVGYQDRDLLVLVISSTTTTPGNATGLWTRIAAQGASQFVTIYVGFALGTVQNAVVTVGNGQSTAVMLAYRGVSAFDVISTFSTATAATSLATNTFTTTYANEYVISVYAGNQVVGTWTAPASTTSRVNFSPTATVNGLLVVDESQTSAGLTTARTATITASHNLSAVAFSIIPSGRYWVGGTGTWTTTTTNWSFSSGGASGAPAPGVADPVFFDQSATYTVTLTGALTCFNITTSAGVVTFASTGTLAVSGSMSLLASTIWSATGLITFNAVSARTVTTNGVVINSSITFQGGTVTIGSGTWSLGSALTTVNTATTTLSFGILTLNGFNLTTGIFSSNNTSPRTLNYGTSNIYLTHPTAGTTVLDMATLTSYTTTGTAGSFGFILDSSVNRTLSHGSTALGVTASPQPKLTVTSPGSATITITATSVFQEFDFSTSGATITGGASIRQSLTLSATGTYNTLNVQAKGTGSSTTVPAVWTTNGKSLGAVSMGLTLTLGPHYQYMNDDLRCTSFTMTAGQWDFSNQPSGVTGPFSIICSGAISITSLGTLTSLTDLYGNLPASFSCTTWTDSGTLSLVNSSITASTSFTQTSGAFTLPTTGTVTTPSFTQTAGTVSLSKALTLSSTYTLTAGTLTLNGVDLTTAIFSSQSASVRSIVFGTNNIYLVSSTAGQTALNLGYTTFTYTGTGGFISQMNVTKTFTATTTPTLTSAVKLYLTSGSAAATFTASSWFDILDFSGYSGTASGTIFVKNLTLTSGGTYTGIVLTSYGTGSYTGNGNTTGTGALTIGTATLAPTATTLSGNFSCGNCLLTTPATTTFNLNGFTLTCVASTFTVNTPNTLLMNAGTINCTTFTTGDSFTLNNGTINPSVSIVVNNGAPSGIFTYSPGGTLGATPAFTLQSGTAVFNQNYALTQSGTFTFAQVAASGVLTLNNVTLSTGGFNRTVSGACTINFGTSGQILLTGNNMNVWNVTGSLITTTGTVSINSTYTGSVGTRTFTFSSSPQFDIRVGSGTGNTIYLTSGATDTVTLGGVVNSVDLTGMTFTYLPGALQVNGSSFIIPATGGSVSASTGLLTFGFSGTSVSISINRAIDNPLFLGSGCVCILAANLVTGSTRSTTINSATLVLNGFSWTTGTFAATIASTRTIAFGTTGVINVTGTGTVWNTGTITLLTITGIPVVNVTSTGSTAITVNSGALPEAQAISFNFTGGTYALTFLGTAGYTAKNVDFTGFAGSWTLSTDNTIYGNWKYSTGMTVTTAPNSLVFGATIGNTQIMTSNGKTTNTIKLTGGGIVGLADPLTLSSDILVEAGTFNSNNYDISTVRISSYTTTTTRAINLGSSIVTMSGLFRVNTIGLTFNAGTSTIAYTGTNSLTVENGSVIGLTFYNFTNTTMGPSNIGITGKNTFNNLTLPTSTSTSAIYTFANDIIVNGNLTIPTPQSNANDDNKLVVASATIGNQVKITVNGQISSLTKIFFRDINAQGTWLPWVGDRLGNISNNNNISFTPGRNKYWSLAGGGNATQVAWALTSGGTPAAANYPLPQDTVIIDNNGLNTSATITFNSTIYFTSINMASRTNAFTLSISNGENVYVSGDWTNGSGLTSVTNVGGRINFNNSLPGYVQNITSAGKLFSSQFYINTAGIVQLLDNFDQDSLVGVQGFELTAGTLTLNGFNLNTAQFNSSSTNVRTINFGSTFINVTHPTAGTSVIAMSNATNFSATGTGGFRANMSVTRTFNCGTGGAPTVAPNLFIFAGASIPTITTLSYFNTLDFTGSTCTPAVATVNVVGLVLASGGTYTNLALNTTGNGTLTFNAKTVVAVTVLSGSPIISGTCTCTTFTVNGGTLTAWGGTIVPTGSFVVTSGNVFLSNGGTLTVTTITQNGGGVYLTSSFTMTAGTSTYTFTAGTLSIYNTGSNQTLSVGRFISNGTGVRFLQLYGFIRLTNATAAAVAVDMANTTNLIVDYGTFYSPAAGFLTAGTVAQTYTIGTTGGSVNNAISITWDSGGTAVPTITTGSWFANFNPSAAGAFTILATTINIANSVTLSSAGTWTNCSFNLRGTGTFNSNTKSCATLTLNSVGAYSLAGAAILCVTYQQTAGSLFCGNSLTCSGTATLSGGSFGISNGTLSCTTFTVNGGTHDWAGGNGTLTASVGIVVSAGSFTYSTGTISAIAAWTLSGGSITFATNYALTATGTFTHTGGSLIINPGVTLTTGIYSGSSTTARRIAFGNTVSAGNISLAHTTAATTVLTMADLTNFSYTGIGGFTTAMNITRTFITGSTAGGSATTAPPLAITSGAAVPQLGSPTLYVSRLNFTGSTCIPNGVVFVTGDTTLVGSVNYNSLTLTYIGNGTLITNNAAAGPAGLTINGANIVCTLNGSYTTTSTGLTLTQGTLDIKGYTVTTPTFTSTGTLTRSIVGSNGTVTITGSGPTAFSNASGTGLTMSGFTINMNSATAKTFAGGGGTYSTLNQGGAGALTISGSNTFDNITNTVQPSTVTFTAGTTQTFNNFNLRGTSGSLVTINSVTAGTRAIFRKASGPVYGDYLSIQDINATGVTGQTNSAPTWYAGTTSTSVSNNLGWIFTQLPIVTMGNVSIDASQGGITFGDQPV
jgi:hypothetical protein